MEKVRTVWEAWTYDVWGNETDGYEVNDKYCLHREYEMYIPIQICNQGTESEFQSAYPTDKQIRNALDLNRVPLALDGDDILIYVNHRSTGYPLGELVCISHESLSPIRNN